MEKLYVICVDDQREVLGSVVRDLADFSDWAQIDECESAKEAEALLDELDSEGRALALIVCDHIMPGENGVDFLARLAVDRRFPHLKKILLTGQASHQDAIDAINKARINQYFEKPWQPEALQASVRTLLSEYLFDSGKYTKAYRSHVDSQVFFNRMSARE